MKTLPPRITGPTAAATESSYSKSATGNPPRLGLETVGIGGT